MVQHRSARQRLRLGNRYGSVFVNFRTQLIIRQGEPHGDSGLQVGLGEGTYSSQGASGGLMGGDDGVETVAPSGPHIFLNYRRDDASAYAGRLYDYLLVASEKKTSSSTSIRLSRASISAKPSKRRWSSATPSWSSSVVPG